MKDTERRIFVAKEYAKRHTLTDEQRRKMIAEKLERGIQLALLYGKPESRIQTR
jgi:hypothetical protein